MGGFGSGRQGWRPMREGLRSLDAGWLSKEGCLVPGFQGAWRWSMDGEETASIGLRAEAGALMLDYRRRPWDAEEWEAIAYAVPVERVPMRLGGTRAYFRCPGVVRGRHCGQRVGKLYFGGRYYLCRHCLNLTYRSRSEDRHTRLMRRRDALCHKLGGEPDAWLPPRPRGMHRATYKRHVEEFIRLEEAMDAELGAWIMRRFGGPEGQAELAALGIDLAELEED